MQSGNDVKTEHSFACLPERACDRLKFSRSDRFATGERISRLVLVCGTREIELLFGFLIYTRGICAYTFQPHLVVTAEETMRRETTFF